MKIIKNYKNYENTDAIITDIMVVYQEKSKLDFVMKSLFLCKVPFNNHCSNQNPLWLSMTTS